MSPELYNMLLKSAEADKAKALLSLELLGNKAIGIGGLNSYYKLKHIESFPYVKLNEIPHFDE